VHNGLSEPPVDPSRFLPGVLSARQPKRNPSFWPAWESPLSSADQLQDGKRRVQQRQSDRHHHHEKQHCLVCEMLGRFVCEVILANSAEDRVASTDPSTIDIIEGRRLVIIVRFPGQIAGGRSRPDQTMSMINLEYWFHVNFLRPPLILAFMLRWATLSLSVGTAFRILRDPDFCSPLGSGAGPILIVGCNDKLRDNLAKKAWRSG